MEDRENYEETIDVPQAEACCASYVAARQPGSDNEYYRSAIHGDGDERRIGAELPPISFCPWCGASKVAIEDREAKSQPGCSSAARVGGAVRDRGKDE